MLWGIRTALTNAQDTVDDAFAQQLFKLLVQLTELRPDPVMWTSLPSVLKELVKQKLVSLESWHQYAIQLFTMFESYDYEREDEKPIEWIQRAINHPVGDIFDLYFELAQENVQAQIKSGEEILIGLEAEHFFSMVLRKYDRGSRYALCLLAQHFSWIEAVSSNLADLMRPAFVWNKNEERALVTWSGFLWGGALSKKLTAEFEDSYLETGKHCTLFARVEKEGLARHVAATTGLKD